MPTGWLSPKLEGRLIEGKGAHAVFAREHVQRGEILAVFGGDVMDLRSVIALPGERRRLALQIDDDAFLVSGDEGPADWVNHSCEPNAGLRGQIVLVALHAIEPGEEICYDYAMSDGSPYDEFSCHCGAPTCRGRVTGDDWRSPDLQSRYRGHFSAYLAARIDHLPTGTHSSGPAPVPMTAAVVNLTRPPRIPRQRARRSSGAKL